MVLAYCSGGGCQYFSQNQRAHVLASHGVAQGSSEHRVIFCIFAGWKEWSTPEAVQHVEEVLRSWDEDTFPMCSLCGVTTEKAAYCPGCSTWTCLKCSGLTQSTISKVCWCADCRVMRVATHRTTNATPTFEWFKTMAKLAAGATVLQTVGGTFRFRFGSIRLLFEWGKHWELYVLPGSMPVYEVYICHRLLVQGVSIATVELDFITISVWHSLMRASIPGLWWHNPTRQDFIRLLIKHLSKEVKMANE